MSKKLDELIERVLFGLVTRLPGRFVGVIALTLYPLLGLILPVTARWNVAWLVSANVAGVSLAGTLCLCWLAVQIAAQRRRLLLEWTSDLRLLDAAEFEWLVGELFRREGWHVEETGQHGAPDGNVDLRLSRAGEKRLVQCKRWQSWQVGVADVRAFAGALLREGMAGKDGIFVTLSDYTPQAREEAQTLGLALLDSPDLYRRVERVRQAEPCPKCSAHMRLDRSPHGWWFHCLTPGCGGKRDLGRDPARAVELLTQHT